MITKRLYHSEWFEPRSIRSSYSVIVGVRVVLKRAVVGDWRFDNLSGSQEEVWRWLPLRLSKSQSPTTVLFRTTLNRTITLYETALPLLNLPGTYIQLPHRDSALWWLHSRPSHGTSPKKTTRMFDLLVLTCLQEVLKLLLLRCHIFNNYSTRACWKSDGW